MSPMPTLYNFKTKTYETRELPTTDEEAVQYIHQSSSVQGLYRVYRAQGCSVDEAMAKVFESVIKAHEANHREP